MPNQPLTAAVIGDSAYARSVHIPFLRGHPDVVLIALAPSRIRAGNVAPATLEGPRRFSDYRTMLDEVGPDLVVVSSPPVPHFRQVKDVLEAGAHVLVDKPMVCSYEEATRIVQIAEFRDLVLGVAVQRRYEDAFVYMRRVISAGEIGKVRLIHASYVRAIERSTDNWRSNPAVSWGGVTADVGYHLIDTALWVCGLEPVAVHAQMTHASKVEDVASLNVTFASGAAGNIIASYVAPPGYFREQLHVFGSQGSLYFARWSDPEDRELRVSLRHTSASGDPVAVPESEGRHNRHAPGADFVAAVLAGKQMTASGRDSIMTVALIESAYRSAESRVVQPIPLDY